jgi:hypothetical protein
MKGILIKGDGCKPCDDLCQEFAEQVAAGEIEVVDINKEPAKAQEYMDKYKTKIGELVIVSNEGKVIGQTG